MPRARGRRRRHQSAEPAVLSLTSRLKVAYSHLIVQVLLVDPHRQDASVQVPFVDRHRQDASVQLLLSVSETVATTGLHERLTLSRQCRVQETSLDLTPARRICIRPADEALLVSRRDLPCRLLRLATLLAINDSMHVGDHRPVEGLADIAKIRRSQSKAIQPRPSNVSFKSLVSPKALISVVSLLRLFRNPDCMNIMLQHKSSRQSLFSFCWTSSQVVKICFRYSTNPLNVTL